MWSGTRRRLNLQQGSRGRARVEPSRAAAPNQCSPPVWQWLPSKGSLPHAFEDGRLPGPTLAVAEPSTPFSSLDQICSASAACSMVAGEQPPVGLAHFITVQAYAAIYPGSQHLPSRRQHCTGSRARQAWCQLLAASLRQPSTSNASHTNPCSCQVTRAPARTCQLVLLVRRQRHDSLTLGIQR